MEKYSSLALEVISLAETKIVAQLRFLSTAVAEMEKQEITGVLSSGFASDGRKLYFHAENVLLDFKTEKNRVAAAMLHVFFHCLMGHPFDPKKNGFRKATGKELIERELWDIACDLAVEGARIQLSKSFLELHGDDRRTDELSRIADYAGADTAQAYYNYFINHGISKAEIEDLSRLFHRDDHRLWINRQNKLSCVERNLPGQQEHDTETGDEDEDHVCLARIADEVMRAESNQRIRDRWKNIAEYVKTDMELFPKRQGIHAGSLMNNMRQMLFEEVDYERFLQIFGAEHEVMKLSDEEFDLIYYTYGLELYQNIPLIEPLELCTDKRIREFVIAIDTSGSVQGEIVENFLRHTCQILQQTKHFFRQVNVCIIQCDSVVQNCTRLTNLEELEDYIKNLSLYGFGGTDFRPVFDYVDQLQREQKLGKLDGLLYFTDGAGIYPTKEPEYKTAFIFYREADIAANVPEWAIKAVLTSDHLQMMKEWE